MALAPPAGADTDGLGLNAAAPQSRGADGLTGALAETTPVTFIFRL
jgi:hypothetical protein